MSLNQDGNELGIRTRIRLACDTYKNQMYNSRSFYYSFIRTLAVFYSQIREPNTSSTTAHTQLPARAGRALLCTADVSQVGQGLLCSLNRPPLYL